VNNANGSAGQGYKDVMNKFGGSAVREYSDLKSELSLVRDMCHPNIVKLYGLHRDAEKRLYILLESAPLDLEKYIAQVCTCSWPWPENRSREGST
jgi:hypothetical protein